MERQMELLDEHAAAHYLGGTKPFSVRTLQRMRVEGTGPRFLKISAAVRYARADLDEFLDQRRRSSTSCNGAAA
jgi:hypothetical protein